MLPYTKCTYRHSYAAHKLTCILKILLLMSMISSPSLCLLQIESFHFFFICIQTSCIKASSPLLKQVRDASSSSSSSTSPAKVERDLEEYLRGGGAAEAGAGGSSGAKGYSASPLDAKSSVAMMTGLTAACAGAGWRRALQEVCV